MVSHPKDQSMPLSPALIYKFRGDCKGYAILEILIAFGVSLIIITGMVYLGVVTIKAGTTAKSYAEAGKIAQREVTRLKLFREISGTWTAFHRAVVTDSGCVGNKCYLSSDANSIIMGEGSYGSGVKEIKYYLTISSASSNEINYIVTTTWNVGARSKTYIIEGQFSNWKEN